MHHFPHFAPAIRGRAIARSALVCCALLAAGCQAFHPPTYTPPPLGLFPQTLPSGNPLLVPVMDRDRVWEEVVDVVDDYFRIEREERPKLIGDLATEGRLDTYYRSGSTLGEFWAGDSANFYERLESTLQSIRRKALVRVIPAVEGYLVEVQVFKELEDVPRPETGTVTQIAGQNLRNDNALSRVTNPVAREQPTIGWIPLGRDGALEQAILVGVQERLGGYPTQPAYAPPPGFQPEGVQPPPPIYQMPQQF